MSLNPRIEVGDLLIGPEFEPVVVAEIGINHGGSLEVAKEMVSLAIDSQVRLIKHQTHIPESEMALPAESVVPGNAKDSIYRVISDNCLSLDDELELASFARSLGAIYFSTPFSREAADFLDGELKTPLFKIGSGECNNYPLVSHVASKGKPVILSTGMNTIETIRPAVRILEEAGVQFALLHTTNLYPTPQRLVRLAALNRLKEAFPQAVIGLSDHSISNSACYAGVALGASILERHFTDSKGREGPDIVCSMTPIEAEELVSVSREIFMASGGEKKAADEESVTMNFAFASVSSIRNIKKGDVFTDQNIFPLRPSGGDFGPVQFYDLLGKRAANDIPPRTQIRVSDVANQDA